MGVDAMVEAVGNASIVAAIGTLEEVNKPGQNEAKFGLKRALKNLEIRNIAHIFYKYKYMKYMRQ
jgi:hypothetical protein